MCRHPGAGDCPAGQACATPCRNICEIGSVPAAMCPTYLQGIYVRETGPDASSCIGDALVVALECGGRVVPVTFSACADFFNASGVVFDSLLNTRPGGVACLCNLL